MVDAMAKKKTSVGRPKTTGTGTLVAVRWTTDQLWRIDTWRAKQPGGLTRPQAIRWLAEQGLERFEK
jgi:hypothetical protein